MKTVKKNTGGKTSTTSANSPLDQLKDTTDILIMIDGKSGGGNYTTSITQNDERIVYQIVRDREKAGLLKNNLLILLDTPRGNAYSAVKIMDILRNVYKQITIAVAERAKSSGTLMCLAAAEFAKNPDAPDFLY